MQEKLCVAQKILQTLIRPTQDGNRQSQGTGVKLLNLFVFTIFGLDMEAA